MRKVISKLFWTLSAACLMTACAKTKPPVCKNTTAKTCTEYSGSAYGDTALQAVIKTQCIATTGGAFTAAGECQTTGALANCTRNTGQTFEQIDRYFTGAAKTIGQIESECLTEGGIFRYN